MKIYFSGSISGGRSDAAMYLHLVERMQTQGHRVLSAHVADPGVLQLEQEVPDSEVYRRDVGWIAECDAMVAEVSTPSLGVGYEYGFAIQLGKPVLCLYRSGLRMSKMITGNPAPNLTVATYTTASEANAALDAFLEQLTR